MNRIIPAIAATVLLGVAVYTLKTEAQVACPPGEATLPCQPFATEPLAGSNSLYGEQNGTKQITIQNIIDAIGVIPQSGQSFGPNQFFATLSTGPGNISLRAIQSTDLPLIGIAQGGTGGTTASSARTNLGLGTAATFNASGAGPTLPTLNFAATGQCAEFSDNVGTLTATPCSGGGGGSGTVGSGATGQIPFYAAPGTVLTANANMTTLTSSSGTLNLGVAGSAPGILNLAAGTSGTVTFQTATTSTVYNWNVPQFAGTAGQPLLSGGGGTNPQTYGTLAIAGGGTGGTTAAAARTNLGLGTASTQNTGQSGATVPLLNGVNVWSGGQSSAPTTLVFGATVTPNFSNGNIFVLTLTGTVTTFANPTNLPAGQCVTVFLIQDGVGNRTISNWGSQYKFPGGTKPVLSTAAGSTDSVSMCSPTNSFIAASFLGNFQ